jgi:hypothetical protein
LLLGSVFAVPFFSLSGVDFKRESREGVPKGFGDNGSWAESLSPLLFATKHTTARQINV